MSEEPQPRDRYERAGRGPLLRRVGTVAAAVAMSFMGGGSLGVVE